MFEDCELDELGNTEVKTVKGFIDEDAVGGLVWSLDAEKIGLYV